jgi:hypothetical protein
MKILETDDPVRTVSMGMKDSLNSDEKQSHNALCS